jgi:hypothetical protein
LPRPLFLAGAAAFASPFAFALPRPLAAGFCAGDASSCFGDFAVGSPSNGSSLLAPRFFAAALGAATSLGEVGSLLAAAGGLALARPLAALGDFAAFGDLAGDFGAAFFAAARPRPLGLAVACGDAAAAPFSIAGSVAGSACALGDLAGDLAAFGDLVAAFTFGDLAGDLAAAAAVVVFFALAAPFFGAIVD